MVRERSRLLRIVSHCSHRKKNAGKSACVVFDSSHPRNGACSPAALLLMMMFAAMLRFAGMLLLRALAALGAGEFPTRVTLLLGSGNFSATLTIRLRQVCASLVLRL